jgi:hypothetical protein
MGNVNISPDMNLPIPVPGVDPGPDYANNINSCFSLIDQHNHASGNGVQINPSGININNDLPFNNNNATLLRSVRFSVQPSALSLATDLGCIYVSGVDLWYNDENGNQIKITSGGVVNATSSGISSGTATASFIAGVLVVNSSSSSPANIQAGSLLMGNSGSLANFLTLSPPTLSSSYTLTLPTVPVGSTAFMTLDTSGNMGASVSTSGGIIDSMIATGTLTADKFAPGVLNTTGLVVSANIPYFSGLSWNVTSATPAQFNTNPSTPTTVLELNPGTFGTASNANGGFPQITITNLVAGYYEVSATFLAGSSLTSEAAVYSLTDGTAITGSLAGNTVSQLPTITLLGAFYYSTLQSSITFSVYGCAPTSTAYINGSAGTNNTQQNTLNWIVKKIG